MGIPEEHRRQNQQLVERLRAQSKECAAAAAEVSGFPATLLENSSQLADELAGYLASPVLEDAIGSFRDSATARSDASVDLTDYLRKAGLEISDRAQFSLRDNNWCLGAHVSLETSDGGEIVFLGHYDSTTGWGSGSCPG